MRDIICFHDFLTCLEHVNYREEITDNVIYVGGNYERYRKLTEFIETFESNVFPSFNDHL